MSSGQGQGKGTPNHFGSWERRQYGTSVLGAPLEVYMPGGDVQSLVVGTIHGDEPESGWMLARVLETVDAADAHAAIVLAINPDGLQQFTRANANSVDLNRNFPDPTWSNDAVRMFPAGTPLVPELREDRFRTTTWRSGTGPASEPESAALVKLATDLGLPFLVNVHTPLHRLSWSGPMIGSIGERVSNMTQLPLNIENEIVERTAPEGSIRAWYTDGLGKSCLTWEFPYERVSVLRQTQLAALQLLCRPHSEW